MRLPQSSTQPLSLRFASIILLTFSSPLLAPHSQAAESSQLVCSPSSLRFGRVAVGQLETQLVTLSNLGQTSVTVSAVSVSDSQFAVSGLTLPVSLAAGQSVNLNVTFTPNTNGWTGARITFTSDASTPTLDLHLSGSGIASGALTVSPSGLSFGSVPVGNSSALTVVLTSQSTVRQTLYSAQIAGSGFALSGASFPLVLNGGESVALNVTFQPQVAGTSGGGIFISGPDINIPLAGTATSVGQLTLTPTNLSFGNVNVGTSTTQASTLTATGGAVTVSTVTSNNSQFSVSGVSFPLTINAGQNVTFDAVFSPSQTGSSSGNLIFASNASDAQATETVNGTGVNPTYSVSLSWTASSSSSVVGYNVYRGTAVGSYAKINSSLDTTTAYTDSTAGGGATYYYAATAVNSNGQESGYSSPIEVKVP
jgi:hypothetical protein